MAIALDSYTSFAAAGSFRRQAWRVWAIGLVVVTLWSLLILAAPIAKASGLLSISSSLYTFFSYLCHQMDGRSFHIEGEKFAVCSRCFGIYAGIVAGFVGYPFWRGIEKVEPLPKFWLIAACVPAAVDWSLTIFGIWENTFISRTITGGLLGFACGTFIVPSVVEITRNFSLRRGTFSRRVA
ncbi:MAG TPA: DUF2085 domain-containing protein [Pyrinomonadaceae bacterium]|nr:DUF2085 domain-containing protein [Pyrinomonadaceae bacterium]